MENAIGFLTGSALILETSLGGSVDVATILSVPGCQHGRFFYFSVSSLTSSVNSQYIELFTFLVGGVCAFEAKATCVLRNHFTTELEPQLSSLMALLSPDSFCEGEHPQEEFVEYVSGCSSQKVFPSGWCIFPFLSL